MKNPDAQIKTMATTEKADLGRDAKTDGCAPKPANPNNEGAVFRGPD
jgi:hypothetical protein